MASGPFIGLGNRPVGQQPLRKLLLKTGDACIVHGRYWVASLGFRYDDLDGDPVAQVVLMPGDLAPYHLKLGPHGEFLRREAVTWELRVEL
jgi:hypothetical protein